MYSLAIFSPFVPGARPSSSSEARKPMCCRTRGSDAWANTISCGITVKINRRTSRGEDRIFLQSINMGAIIGVNQTTKLGIQS